MGESPQVGSLQIDEDLEFERRQWSVQRAAWAFFALLLLGGLLGLFGSGPLSHADVSSGPLILEYDRLARQRAPTALQIQLGPEAVRDGEVTLWLDRAYLQVISIEQMMPEPAQTVAAANRVLFRFPIARQNPDSEITLTIEPEEPGLKTGRLGVEGGPEVTFQQFIFP